MRDRARYLDWLTLVSHELFHAWNGKRLRPIELGPFDYEREVHTRSLWVTEGLTVYYGGWFTAPDCQAAMNTSPRFRMTFARCRPLPVVLNNRSSRRPLTPGRSTTARTKTVGIRR